MTSHPQQCQINNEQKKFRLYSWHLVYYKKNNVVQKFKLSVNSVSCKATCSYSGNLKEKKKEIHLVDVICWRSMWFGWITLLVSWMQCIEAFHQIPRLHGCHFQNVAHCPPHNSLLLYQAEGLCHFDIWIMSHTIPRSVWECFQSLEILFLYFAHYAISMDAYFSM